MHLLYSYPNHCAVAGADDALRIRSPSHYCSRCCQQHCSEIHLYFAFASAFHLNINTSPAFSRAICPGSVNCSSMASIFPSRIRFSRCRSDRPMLLLATFMFLQIINRRCVFDLLRSCLAPGLCMTRITTKNGYSAGFQIASHCHILFTIAPFFPPQFQFV